MPAEPVIGRYFLIVLILCCARWFYLSIAFVDNILKCAHSNEPVTERYFPMVLSVVSRISQCRG